MLTKYKSVFLQRFYVHIKLISKNNKLLDNLKIKHTIDSRYTLLIVKCEKGRVFKGSNIGNTDEILINEFQIIWVSMHF